MAWMMLGGNPVSSESIVANLTDLFQEDLDLRARSFDEQPGDLIEQAMGLRTAKKLCYTAFDGDHQMLCPLMRKFVLQYPNYTPVNPPAILGYRDVSMARHAKGEILRDDLTLLGRCSHLAVFTSVPFSDLLEGRAWEALAEGLLVELLYHLGDGSRKELTLVSIPKLLAGETECVPLHMNQQELVACLSDNHARELLAYLEDLNGMRRSIEFVATDPLDYKYSEWARQSALNADRIGLVPYLGLPLEDFVNVAEIGDKYLNRAIESWISLLSIADRVVIYKPLHPYKGRSRWVQILESLAVRQGVPVEERDWSNVGVIKATVRQTWAISSREKEEFKPRKHPDPAKQTPSNTYDEGTRPRT